MPQINPHLSGFKCVRCATDFPIGDYYEGCPSCASDGFPASVRAYYQNLPAYDSGHPENWLAYSGWPTLGEGNTPLFALPNIGSEIGIANLMVKFEGANPTGSHKDRMSMLAVARALDVGASKVIAASSGNAGASLAAYAGAAGLECVIVTTSKIGLGWRKAIEMHGARMEIVEDSTQRWHFTRKMVESEGWFPITNYALPAVGSNVFGVDGYRTIAFELAQKTRIEENCHVFVPTARADVLWGVARGFADLADAGHIAARPKVHAVEPFPRISVAIEGGGDYRSTFEGATKMSSIAGTTVTYQALDALELCGGSVCVVDDEQAIADQRFLARHGLYLELSSAAPLSALRQLRRDGVVGANDSAILLATSHGYKV